MVARLSKPAAKVAGLARSWALVVLVAGASAGCAAGVFDPSGYTGAVKSAVGITGPTDEAMAALQKGDYARAEAVATQVVRGDTKNGYGRYVLGEVYRATGRPNEAKLQYEAIISMGSTDTLMVGSGESAKRVTLTEIAQDRLLALNPPRPRMEDLPHTGVAIDEPVSGPETAVIRRFKTLQRLLDEGLITQDEFNQRRGANLGALLPYVAAPPTAGLEAEPPAPSEVVDRMKTLVAAYQSRSISFTQQQTERAIILESLLPAASTRRADPPKPVDGAVMAAEIMGRETRFLEAGVISPDEENKVKKVVFEALAVHEAKLVAAARLANGERPVGDAIRLGTYGSEDKAMQAWAAMIKQMPGELAGLQPVVKKVALRRGGSVYQLNAGPLADKKAARDLCRIIARHHQSCAPTVLK